MPFTITKDTTVLFMTVSFTLWLGYSQLMIKHTLFSLVIRMRITLSGWSLSILLIIKAVMPFIFQYVRL